MRVHAFVHNRAGQHITSLQTNDRSHTITIAPKSSGFGSSASGGELLLLALATCYCNDIYREAAKRGILVEQVEVEVAGEFAAEGAPATNVSYRAKVVARAEEHEIRALMAATDAVAEVQNTLRAGAPVVLAQMEAVSV